MGLEFGKWLLDVAKYILTALFLATFFGDMETPIALVSAVVLMLVMLCIGLWLIKKYSNNNNTNNKKRRKGNRYGRK